MAVFTLSLADLKDASLEELLLRVIREQLSLKVRLSDGQIVNIQPEPQLKPLPVLEGSVPDGWKDAIYA